MNKCKVQALFVGIMLGLSVMSGAHAASAKNCKGLESRPCNANTACSWVDGYKRKDGVSVTAHCRTRRGGNGHSRLESLRHKASS